jgi:hypothetical protein
LAHTAHQRRFEKSRAIASRYANGNAEVTHAIFPASWSVMSRFLIREVEIIIYAARSAEGSYCCSKLQASTFQGDGFDHGDNLIFTVKYKDGEKKFKSIR